MINNHDKSPNEILETLKNMPVPDKVSDPGTIDFTLSYKNENFIIYWNVPSPDNWDWIGIYKNATDSSDKYLDYQWVAGKIPPYKTKVKVNSGYQARYYRWDTFYKDYKLVNKTAGFPDIKVSSEYNVPGTRAITDTEYNRLKNMFPGLNRNNVRVTGEITTDASKHYNCIAWSIGFDDRWLRWNPTAESGLTALYISYGCSEESRSSSNAKIDAWSYNGRGTHGSVKYPNSALYESKLGQNLRITHGRYDLQSTAYGSVYKSFRTPVVFNSMIFPVPASVFTDTEATKLKDAINDIQEDTRLRFEELFEKWKSNWFTGDFRFSSDTNDMVNVDGYNELLSMGTGIIPLVIGKLNEEGNFVALVLYDELQKDGSLVIKYTNEDPLYILLEGEQTRAKRTVKLWLSRLNK
jgi:hypothetical protein